MQRHQASDPDELRWPPLSYAARRLLRFVCPDHQERLHPDEPTAIALDAAQVHVSACALQYGTVRRHQVFVVKNGRLGSNAVDTSILLGIVRDSVLQTIGELTHLVTSYTHQHRAGDGACLANLPP